jgi:aryl-alcohol dehydrogenase-like predicted oxidoreductase
LGQTGISVFRLGLSGTYRPSRKTVHKALNEGVNYFFCYGFDTQMIGALRELSAGQRERYVVASGLLSFPWWRQDPVRVVERRLRQLRTDYVDVFHFLGVTRRKMSALRVIDGLAALRASDKVRAVSVSTHDRRLAGELAADGVVDVLMVRYNAAHRGVEEDVFPHLMKHRPGLVSYTATRWGHLTKRPRGLSPVGRVPTAGECYRFVLSNPNVDVCLTAPSDLRQFEENLAAVRRGALGDDDMSFMREFGDVVYRQRKWFA